MKNQIIIHAAGKQTRIALLENGELAQLFIESPENQRTVGDIYLAEVRKVMGGIRAAFIDMHTPKDAFLHFSDLGEHLDNYLVMLNGKDALNKDAVSKLQELRSKKDPNQTNKNGTNTEEQNILGNMLKPGQKVLVQIVKEPIGSKGPRVSTNISIAGRFLVLIPMGDYVAVSKRIKSYKERRKLRQIVSDIIPDGFGVIVRTVAEGQDTSLIEEDLRDVLEKWNNIVKNIHTAKPPALLHRDLEMTESLVRDLFAKDFDRILVDDPKMHKSLKQYVSKIAPGLLPNIELYKGSEHVFDHMRIMQDVESVFSPRVKMPSGGYLIFEQTEAMYVVDVNSGRYAAKKAQEDNSLKTNLEAAREIAKQLRLRDIGGIIVVDFIDLRDDVNRKKVYDELKKEFRKDRAKTNLLPMSDFGLVQITRQRIRPSVVKSVSRVCPMCGGGGSIVSQNTLLSDIEGWLQKFKHSTKYRAVDLHINPYMRGMLTRGWVSQHFKWMLKYRLRIGLIEDQTLSMNDYKFTLSGSDVDITETIVMDQSIEQAIKAAEQRIAELESELKRDSTTLDIYRKEKSESPATKGSKPNRDDDRSDSSDQRSNHRGGQSQGYRSGGHDKPFSKSASTHDTKTTKATSEKEESGEVLNSQTEKSGERSTGNRQNKNISKYFKKSDEDSRGEHPSVEKSDTPNKSSGKPQPDQSVATKEQDLPTSVTDTEIPEELSHLRSAWVVAREYQLKREKEKSEAQSHDTNEEAIKADRTTSQSGDLTENTDTNSPGAASSDTMDEDNTDDRVSIAAADGTESGFDDHAVIEVNDAVEQNKTDENSSKEGNEDGKAATAQILQAVIQAKKTSTSTKKTASTKKTTAKSTKTTKTTKKVSTPKSKTSSDKKATKASETKAESKSAKKSGEPNSSGVNNQPENGGNEG